MRLIDADSLMPLFIKKAYTMKDRHGVKPGEDWLLNYNDIKDVIDNAQPVVVENATSERPQGDVVYLCDGDNCPAEKASCQHGGPCRHTTNIEHAINFRRFHDTDTFYEVENVMRIEGQENL